MKIIIITSFTKNIEYDNYGINDFSEISVLQNLKYCQKNSYDFLVDRVDYKYKDFNPTWLKIPFILNILENTNYDLVVWIDSDAIFSKNIKIEDLHEKNITLTQCTPSDSSDRQYTITSTGFISIKNNEFSKNIFRKLLESVELPEYSSFQHFNWHEQGLLDKIFIEQEIQNITDENCEILMNYSKENLKSPLVTNNFKILPHSYQVENFVEKTEFIYHACGNLGTKFNRIKNAINQSQML